MSTAWLCLYFLLLISWFSWDSCNSFSHTHQLCFMDVVIIGMAPLKLSWKSWAQHPSSTCLQHSLTLLPCWQGSFFNVLSQWETTLHCNVVSHWLGAYTKWFLCWLHDMEPFSSKLAFNEGIDPRCKGIVISNFDVSFVVNLHMLFSKRSSWWFDSNDACVTPLLCKWFTVLYCTANLDYFKITAILLKTGPLGFINGYPDLKRLVGVEPKPFTHSEFILFA